MINSRLVKYLSVVGVDMMESSSSSDNSIDKNLNGAGLSTKDLDDFSQRYSKNIKMMTVGNNVALAGAVVAILQFAEYIHLSGVGVDSFSSLSDVYQICNDLGWDNVFFATTFVMENGGDIFELIEVLGLGAEVADTVTDFTEALATGGLSLVSSFLAKKAVEMMNHENENILADLDERTKPVRNLHLILQKMPSSPEKHRIISELIPLVSEQNLRFA